MLIVIHYYLNDTTAGTVTVQRLTINGQKVGGDKGPHFLISWFACDGPGVCISLGILVNTMALYSKKYPGLYYKLCDHPVENSYEPLL